MMIEGERRLVRVVLSDILLLGSLVVQTVHIAGRVILCSRLGVLREQHSIVGPFILFLFF